MQETFIHFPERYLNTHHDAGIFSESDLQTNFKENFKMNQLLNDLCSHQTWADAEQWRAILACGAASRDKEIFERLHHIHLVQHGYLSIVSAKGLGFRPTKLSDFPTIIDLLKYARDFHNRISAFLTTLEDGALNDKVVIPWAQTPTVDITTEQALLQLAMHSHYHRAQNARRLREVGGEPTTIDFIQWLWKGRPVPQWE